MKPRVLFISKPITPPWNDGSKNLVRDLASHLSFASPTVMSFRGVPLLESPVSIADLGDPPEKHASHLSIQWRVMGCLVKARAFPLWHFVFAPNLASSVASLCAVKSQRLLGWSGKVVQTVASAPKTFRSVQRLLFGDQIIVLSEWMRHRFMSAGVDPQRMHVIPPCAVAPPPPSEAEIQAVRSLYQLENAPVILYPGDYEVSRGAITVAQAVPHILRAIPEARIVFACRPKTTAYPQALQRIQTLLEPWKQQVRYIGNIPNMAALQKAACMIVFPVDDLYGKVDLPLVLLEALALGTPLILAKEGPLETIDAARFVAPRNPEALSKEVLFLCNNQSERQALIEQGRELYTSSFTPEVVAQKHDQIYAALIKAE
ncbi:glycosyltransferase family 4 protein [Pajaroellobacter abortibovis]|uniref:Glycosyl transferase family 1 domain-containing protein n=1 Tax=Pajaroellobacter abortibovis TaxID=1882918 RepID=A0A1L6MY08_9BACT|nr:glycosyltransferase family 4 protein [Pajaroellobacter abortibovis]APS00278.1 hypothetical protein BCY86_05960 [Pajaroellobacter abortibovis]